MKDLARKILISGPACGLIDSTLGLSSRIYVKLRNLRSYSLPTANPDRIEERLVEVFRDLVVCNGPFKGMKYPGIASAGSAIYPKLLGCYEMELSGIVEHILKQPYTAIVDIGCAEGYYAIGFGMRVKHAKIFAFDTSDTARSLCREMATLNGIEAEISGFCDQEKLKSLDLGERALIFCDCEGYESELFDAQLARSLSRHDFLIEAHDFVEKGLTKRLLDELSTTHECDVIESSNDDFKPYNCKFKEIEEFNYEMKRWILAEHRPQTMQWIFARARNQR
jgi:hypothetical protein